MAGSINAYQEQIFFHYILENQNLVEVTEPEFFTNKNLRNSYEIAREFCKEYKLPPSKDQMWELVRIKGMDQDLSEDVVNALWNTRPMMNQYEDEWLDNHVGAWIRIRNVENTFRKGMAYLKNTACYGSCRKYP